MPSGPLLLHAMVMTMIKIMTKNHDHPFIMIIPNIMSIIQNHDHPFIVIIPKIISTIVIITKIITTIYLKILSCHNHNYHHPPSNLLLALSSSKQSMSSSCCSHLHFVYFDCLPFLADSIFGKNNHSLVTFLHYFLSILYHISNVRPFIWCFSLLHLYKQSLCFKFKCLLFKR